MNSTAVDSSDDENEMDYCLKALAVKLIGSSLVKQQINCIKISLDYIMGLNQNLWNMLNLDYFHSFVHSEDFIP